MFFIWRSNVQGSQRPVTHPHQIGAIFLSFLNIHKSAMYISSSFSSSSFTSFFLANRLMSWSDAKKCCYPTRVALLWPSTHMFTNVFIWWTGWGYPRGRSMTPHDCAQYQCVPKCAAHCVCQSVQHIVCTKVCNTLCVPNSLSRSNVANKKFIPYWHKIQVFSAKNVKSYFYLKYNC